ncbi:TRAP transporter substrate-binding protein [Sporolactobacillus vineae]|uniref:TRAP transporter substrate-binding protein n=1 Tax=Sporolactobacillus vineae TaxID=444463 RepID=UPI0002890974|nr:TRAP transporter substrate-binding protein [Sporolactobacillus vineae]
MQFKKAITIALSLLLAIALSGCSSTNGSSSSKAGSSGAPITLKFAHVGSLIHQDNIYAEDFKKMIEKDSKGKIKVKIYPNGQLGAEDAEIQGVQTGSIDMTEVAADSSLAQVVPVMNVFGIPYLMNTRSQVYHVLDGGIGSSLLKEVDKHQLIGLGFSEVGFRNITNSKHPIKTPADMKGLKIRIQPAPVWNAFMKELGAVPTSISFTELYSSLQQGVVDGQENPIATINAMKFYEVNKYLSLTKHSYTANVVLMSPATWKKLSPDQQKLVKADVQKAYAEQRDYLAKTEQQTLNNLKAKGIIITNPDIAAFKAATKNSANAIAKFVPKSLVNKIENTK